MARERSCLAVFPHLGLDDGRPSTVGQSSDEEIGAEVAKQVEAEIGLYQAPVTRDYVRAIGSRLVSHLEDNEFAFRFNIVDQFDPNAFAAPGGWVYVSRGLLVLANSEDELAGVIGHEITHVTERHSAGRQRRGLLGGILKIPGNIVGVVVGKDIGDLINSPLDTIGQISLASYSRGQESEADRLGMRLAAGAATIPSRWPTSSRPSMRTWRCSRERSARPASSTPIR